MFISTIPQGHCRIIERFGKPIVVQHSGLRFKIPIIDKVKNVSAIWGGNANKEGVFIELTEQLIDTKPRNYITSDNVKVVADCVIRWRIVDPIKAVYEVDNFYRSLTETILNSMRGEIGSRSLDSAIKSRHEISESVLSNVSDILSRWGVQLIAIELQEIKTDSETETAMRQIIEAERRSKAIAAEAKGVAEATIAKAEAEKRAAIMKAEGVNESLKIIAESENAYLETLCKTVSKEDAVKILSLQKTIDGFGILTSKPGDKFFIPSNIRGFINFGDEK